MPKSESITIRLPPTLRANIDMLAAEDEMNVSEWIRDQLRQAVRRELKGSSR